MWWKKERLIFQVMLGVAPIVLGEKDSLNRISTGRNLREIAIVHSTHCLSGD
jgi:hypothetical protein